MAGTHGREGGRFGEERLDGLVEGEAGVDHLLANGSYFGIETDHRQAGVGNSEQLSGAHSE